MNSDKRYVSMNKLLKYVGEKKPVEIQALDNDQFLKVRETLTRIGIATTVNNENVLWQSCHLLSKKGKYYIVHFKHMFILDGKHESTDITDDDINRTKYIASLLQSWGLITIENKDFEFEKTNLKVINYDEKKDWILKQKYKIAKNKLENI